MNSQKLLVITAHPDDAEIMCYGTIAKYLSKGYTCKLIIASEGKNGGSNNRKKESSIAFSKLDIDMYYLNLDDGNILFNISLMSKLRDLILEYNPSVIITHYPDTKGIEHQDHTVVAKAVINIITKIQSNVNLVLLAEPLISEITDFKPNMFVDISAWAEEKKIALKKHISQSNKFYMNSDFINLRLQMHSMSVPSKSVTKAYEAFEILFQIV